MSDKKIRWGVLGVAKINQRIFPSFARSGNAELYAIASRSLEKAKAAAKADGIAKAYGSYEDLLADPNVDVVYNPLPNSMHAEWTKKAADAGKNILCEKPLAPTADEAQGILDYCNSKNVKLMDGFMWPHHPRTAKLREVLDSGAIGEIRRVTGAFTFPMDPFDGSNIRLKPEMGGGSLLDVGCYPVFGIRWIFQQEPVKVFAQARFEFGVDAEMCGVVWFADGRMASFDCGFTMPIRMPVEIAGTKGVINIPQMWLPEPEGTFTIRRLDEEKTETVSVPNEDQIAHMIRNFSASIQNNTAVPACPGEAIKTLRVLDALAKSARSGQVESVVV